MFPSADFLSGQPDFILAELEGLGGRNEGEEIYETAGNKLSLPRAGFSQRRIESQGLNNPAKAAASLRAPTDGQVLRGQYVRVQR